MLVGRALIYYYTDPPYPLPLSHSYELSQRYLCHKEDPPASLHDIIHDLFGKTLIVAASYHSSAILVFKTKLLQSVYNFKRLKTVNLLNLTV